MAFRGALHQSVPACRYSPLVAILEGSAFTALTLGVLGVVNIATEKAVTWVEDRRLEHAHTNARGPPLTSDGGADACPLHLKSIQDCVAASRSDVAKCQSYVDLLNQPRKST